LIEEIKGPFGRHARYYRASTYGLISYFGRVITKSDGHIKHNKEDIVIQCLLLQFFEEKTIDSFYRLGLFPTKEICDYLHDCCSVTISICREHWNKIKQFNIEDILPSDEVIQKYMAYLDGKKAGQFVLKEIIQYEKRLLKQSQINEGLRLIYNRLKENQTASFKKAPVPLGYIYDNIVCIIKDELKAKIESLTNTLVTGLGEYISLFEEEKTVVSLSDHSLLHILKDEKFFKLVMTMKENFNLGYEKFLHYRE